MCSVSTCDNMTEKLNYKKNNVEEPNLKVPVLFYDFFELYFFGL